MTKLMKDKSGLVTAAGSGIGRASAIALAKAGARVMVSDVNEDAVKETVRLIEEFASAIALAKAGAKVMVSDVNEDAVKETVRLIEEFGGEAKYFMCDVSDEKQVKALVDETVAKFGKLDFAHNNAGINIGQTKIGEMDSAAWDKTLQVTLYGTFY